MTRTSYRTGRHRGLGRNQVKRCRFGTIPEAIRVKG